MGERRMVVMKKGEVIFEYEKQASESNGSQIKDVFVDESTF